MEVNRFFLNLLILSSIFITISRSDDADCVYTLYIRTSTIIKGGTDSIITTTFYDADGYGIKIKNIEAWGGLMGPGYDYFERGNLDIFSGRGPCLSGPICAMNLSSDGSGSGHGWYCNYIEVTSTGVHLPCSHLNFEVEQWLATDAPPYQLSTFQNLCNSDLTAIHHPDSSTLSVI
ncbi:PLAT domain-containing protein 3-like [Salvia miltiorrhiza]|uniref:PLAT domain-containing protein 3-like n=1 Tax=Salvia miltiorrhiza TaxID=226208 RepID=UPI0025AB84CA|nr:PLAT domain-containing protein 3-like [Salvia miltiorrhiza]